jgi:KipI family sensor histidine kinase inhibitor
VFEFDFLGDTALQLRFCEGSPNAQVLPALADALLRLEHVSEAVVAFASITLLLKTGACSETVFTQCQQVVSHWRSSENGQRSAQETAQHLLQFARAELSAEIAQDLTLLAKTAGIRPAQWLARFCQLEFRVGMIGFKPGFPYLLGLPPELAMPRRATPRTAVPAGAVAVGGAYAGIYPSAAPGGWHIIGVTRAPLFDAHRTPPSLLQVGDRVRFEFCEH